MTTQETAQGAGVRELGHLVLYVADIGTSTAFYEDALAGGVSRRLLSLEPSDRTLLERPHPSRAAAHRSRSVSGSRAQGRHLGLYHFGLRIGDTDDDLRQIRDRLNALGCRSWAFRTMA